jgi:hypothetical protein
MLESEAAPISDAPTDVISVTDWVAITNLIAQFSAHASSAPLTQEAELQFATATIRGRIRVEAFPYSERDEILVARVWTAPKTDPSEIVTVSFVLTLHPARTRDARISSDTLTEESSECHDMFYRLA